MLGHSSTGNRQPATRSSKDNTKRGECFRWFAPRDFNIRYLREKRSLAHMLDEFLELIAISLSDDLDFEIWHVAHVSGERQVPRMLYYEITIKDSLHFTRYDTINFFYFHI